MGAACGEAEEVSDVSEVASTVEVKPLRRCCNCGIEAWTKEDLNLFRTDKSRKHGKRNQCKSCGSNYSRKIYYKYPLRDRYRNMIDRCYNPKHKSYPIYGGRGIYVCDEWRNDRQAFIDWAMVNGFKPELQIDRIDNYRPYSPENCRWVTSVEQNLNKRTTTTFLDKGTRICSKCRIEKPFSDFHKLTTRKRAYGHQNICKICISIRDKERWMKKKSMKTL